jgi:hypothetical protein
MQQQQQQQRMTGLRCMATTTHCNAHRLSIRTYR